MIFLVFNLIKDDTIDNSNVRFVKRYIESLGKEVYEGYSDEWIVDDED